VSSEQVADQPDILGKTQDLLAERLGIEKLRAHPG
jgi:hypothetical protein